MLQKRRERIARKEEERGLGLIPYDVEDKTYFE